MDLRELTGQSRPKARAEPGSLSLVDHRATRLNKSRPDQAEGNRSVSRSSSPGQGPIIPLTFKESEQAPSRSGLKKSKRVRYIERNESCLLELSLFCSKI